MKEDNKNKINRRDFFKLAGAGTLASAAALYGCSGTLLVSGKYTREIEDVTNSYTTLFRSRYDGRGSRTLVQPELYRLSGLWGGVQCQLPQDVYKRQV